MAGERINSGKKIEYAKQTCELTNEFKANLASVCEQLNAQSDKMKTAVVDRLYNRIGSMADTLITCGNTVVKSIADELIGPLTQDKYSGKELVIQATKVQAELEACYSKSPEIVSVSQATIEGRGLEENFTDATKGEFVDLCSKFIAQRKIFITRLGEITNQNKEADTSAAYIKIGKNAEEVANATVDTYNKFMKEMEEAGFDIDKLNKAVEENAGAAIGSIGQGDLKSILEDVADV